MTRWDNEYVCAQTVYVVGRSYKPCEEGSGDVNGAGVKGME